MSKLFALGVTLMVLGALPFQPFIRGPAAKRGYEYSTAIPWVVVIVGIGCVIASRIMQGT